MKFTHDGKTIEVELEDLAAHEGMAIKRVTGFNLKQFGKALEDGDPDAFGALGWVLIKFRMDKPEVTFDDISEGRVVFRYRDLSSDDAETPDPPTRAKAKVKIPS